MNGSASLFDQPAQPVLGSAGAWVTELLSGSLATGLCVVAVAILGAMMLFGRLPVRQGVQVVLGCFVLLGASALASGLLAFGETVGGAGPVEVTAAPDVEPEAQQPLPPANYDPYAGASLRPQ